MTYREQMFRAEKASQDTPSNRCCIDSTQQSCVVRIQQMKRLNSGVLSRSPAFSNGERYEFKRTVRKDYEELLLLCRERSHLWFRR